MGKKKVTDKDIRSIESLLTNQSDSCFANLGEGLFCR